MLEVRNPKVIFHIKYSNFQNRFVKKNFFFVSFYAFVDLLISNLELHLIFDFSLFLSQTFLFILKIYYSLIILIIYNKRKRWRRFFLFFNNDIFGWKWFVAQLHRDKQVIRRCRKAVSFVFLWPIWLMHYQVDSCLDIALFSFSFFLLNYFYYKKSS